MALVRHLDVDDGEHHEDVGLQQDDQDVEDGPAQPEDDGKERTYDARSGKKPEQEENDFARVHVSEESQRMRQRLGGVLDDVEEKVQQEHEGSGIPGADS